MVRPGVEPCPDLGGGDLEGWIPSASAPDVTSSSIWNTVSVSLRGEICAEEITDSIQSSSTKRAQSEVLGPGPGSGGLAAA
ncbi:unnamed protein product, partial [Rangifer tarandus platyrhynchus]